jgi:hypothetical protein
VQIKAANGESLLKNAPLSSATVANPALQAQKRAARTGAVLIAYVIAFRVNDLPLSGE